MAPTLAQVLAPTPEDFLTRGLFPDRTIPPFGPIDLYGSYADLAAVVEADIAEAESKNWRGLRSSRYAEHSVPKRKHLRRQFAIPNPHSHLMLCKEICDNYQDLLSICSSSQISLTTPQPSAHRALEYTALKKSVAHERATRSVGARYLLKADFARFYPSIYTHSLPWAIHEKNVARMDKKNLLFGNRLDLFLRNTQDKQTGGIPIGPDTSYLLAEVLASRIDVDLQAALGNELQGTRFIDDFHLYFDTLSEAERALSALHRVAGEYELDVNDLKTEIIPLPEPLEPFWVTQLRAIPLAEDITSVKALFDRGFELAREFPHDSVLKYVAKKALDSPLSTSEWSTVQPLLLRSCYGEPTMLPLLVQTYSNKADRDELHLKRMIENLCAYHGPLHQGYEVAWSLWLAKNLKLTLSNETAAIVSQMDDDMVALVALDMRDSGLLPLQNVSIWESHLNEAELYSEHWLLAYEARERGWLTAPGNNYVNADPFFGLLALHEVRFYNDKTTWGEEYEFGYSSDEVDMDDETAADLGEDFSSLAF